VTDKTTERLFLWSGVIGWVMILGFFGYIGYQMYLDSKPAEVIITGFQPKEKVVIWSAKSPPRSAVADEHGVARFERVPPGYWAIVEGGTSELREVELPVYYVWKDFLGKPKGLVVGQDYKIQLKFH